MRRNCLSTGSGSKNSRLAKVRRRTFIALPNGSRLSCGAKWEGSQIEDYLRKRGAVSFKRLLGGRLTKVVGESDDDDGEPDRHPDATHDETPPCLARARQRAVGSSDHPSST